MARKLRRVERKREEKEEESRHRGGRVIRTIFYNGWLSNLFELQGEVAVFSIFCWNS
jgi:hypothetical protein